MHLPTRSAPSGLGFWDVFDGLADTVSSGWDSLTSGVSDWFGGADSFAGDDSFWDYGGTDWGVAWGWIAALAAAVLFGGG